MSVNVLKNSIIKRIAGKGVQDADFNANSRNGLQNRIITAWKNSVDNNLTVHLMGSQVGTGTSDITIDTSATKRLLCVTKKSGVIVGTKEIPTSVFESGDVVPLGNESPVVTTDSSLSVYPDGTEIKLAQIALTGSYLTSISEQSATGSTKLTANLSNADGATLTYNGSNSFTIEVTDSTLSVYIYADAMVSGGSAEAANVAFDGAGTDLQATDVNGAIVEVNNNLINYYTLLWTNDNPSVNFTPQTININLSQYRYIGLSVYDVVGTNPFISPIQIVEKGQMSFIHAGGNRSRLINSSNNNGITFGNGTDGTSDNNGYALPCKIYGIK